MPSNFSVKNQRFFPLAAGLLLLVLTLAIYAPTWNYGFVSWDDPAYLNNQFYIKQGITIESLRWILTSFVAGNWHPLTLFSYQLDIALFGFSPSVFHTTNSIFHAVNSILVFYFFRENTGSFWKSFLIALFFSIHPLHVESVAWISERKDVLCAFFWLLTLIFYAKYSKNKTLKNYLIVSLFLALSLLSKPMAVTLPFALLLLDYWPLNRFPIKFGHDKQTVMRLLLEKLPWVCMALGVTFISFHSQSVTIHDFPLLLKLEISLAAIGFYVYKTLLPLNLSHFYTIGRPSSPYYAILGLIVIFGMSTWGLKKIKTAPWVITGWLWFIGTLIPVIGIVKLGEQAYADRYVYIPHIGLFWLMAWSIDTHPVRKYKKIIWGLTVLFFFLCLTSTIQRIPAWKNSQALYESALLEDAKNYNALAGLAMVYAEQGKSADALKTVKLAISQPSYGKQTLKIYYDVLADHELKRGNISAAHAAYLKSHESAPSSPEPLMGLGYTAQRLGNISEAEHWYRKAISTDPTYSEAYNNLGVLLEKTGREQEALSAFEQSVRYWPQNRAAQNNLLRLQGMAPLNR